MEMVDKKLSQMKQFTLKQAGTVKSSSDSSDDIAIQIDSSDSNDEYYEELQAERKRQQNEKRVSESFLTKKSTNKNKIQKSLKSLFD